MSDSQTIYVNEKPFFGRRREQVAFRGLLPELRNPPAERDQPAIVLLFGNGGMGKTTLTQRFEDIAAGEEPFAGDFNIVRIDWETERKNYAALNVGKQYLEPELIFSIIHKHVAKFDTSWRGKAFRPFLQARGEMDKVRDKARLIVEQAHDSKAFSEELTTTSIATVVTAPVGGVGESLIKLLLDRQLARDDSTLNQLTVMVDERLRRELSSGDYRLLTQPFPALAERLAEGITVVSRNKPLLIILDTYEIVDAVDHWVRQVLKGSGARTVWVISGRQNLARSGRRDNVYFTGYEADFARHLLVYDMAELAREDVRAYFEEEVPERPLAEDELEAIARATRGIPLAVAQAATIWAKPTVTLAEIVGGLNLDTPRGDVVRLMADRYFLHCLKNPRDQRLLYALALAEGNKYVYPAMLQTQLERDESLTRLLNRLRVDYASVHLEEARLHDEPALFLRQRLYEDEQLRNSYWLIDMQQQAIKVLQRERRNIEADLGLMEEWCEDEDWQQHTERIVSHQLWLDEQAAWQEIIPRYVEGWGYSRTLQRNLVQLLHEWKDNLSARGKKWLKLLDIGVQPNWLADPEKAERLLRQFERWATQGQLNGQNEDERLALLALKQGQLAKKKKQLLQAERFYQEAKRGLPNDGEQLKEQLSQALYDLAIEHIWPDGRRLAVSAPQAIPLLAQVVEWQPRLQKAWFAYSSPLIDIEDYDQALIACQKAVDLNPIHAQAHNSLGIVYNKQGRYEEAIAAYEESIRLDPKNAAYSWNGLGNVYDNQGRYEEAIAAYEESIRLDPKYATPWNGLGNIYYNQGRYEEAIAAYEESIRLDPKDANPWNGLGNVYYDQEQYEESIQACKRSIELDPRDAAYPWNRLGASYFKERRYEESIAAYEESIRLDPKFDYPWNGLGNVYKRQGRYEEAIAAYEESIRLDPKDALPWNSLGVAQLAQGDVETAEKSFRRSIELKSDFANPYRYLSVCYWLKDDVEEALLALRKALSLTPDYFIVRVVLAAITRQSGDLEQYKQHVEEAEELIDDGIVNPVKAWNFRELAALAAVKGKAEEARRLLRECFAIAPGERGLVKVDPPFQFLYGTACWWELFPDEEAAL